ncbi:uncharacterized protein TrAtP1_000667 [Trichoderma atroviride]|uniref:uncharacterized protein n=1 Tax=Hypocrea atroviridis TaxID=63577 RepID=UPI003327910B|nr:hypothetical protein TrAtP1_000667 [Trichoderma atroviride]
MGLSVALTSHENDDLVIQDNVEVYAVAHIRHAIIRRNPLAPRCSLLKSTFELRTAGRWLVAMYQIHIHHQQVVCKLESLTADYYLTKKEGALHFSQV